MLVPVLCSREGRGGEEGIVSISHGGLLAVCSEIESA
jgi:hypothetical protein